MNLKYKNATTITKWQVSVTWEAGRISKHNDSALKAFMQQRNN